jgi:hypothetical protein
MIYFIESGDYVKVGYTSDIKNRYKKYVTENPNQIKLLATFKGGYDTEKKIHRQLKEYHHRGEWFKFNDEVRELLIQIKKENANNIEPVHIKKKKNKSRHLETLSHLKEYATASGLLGIQPHIKVVITKELGISQTTFTRHITKLLKLKKMSRLDSLYYIL